MPPDLSVYDNDEPAASATHFFAHTTMYADLIRDGVCAIVPFGYARASDIEHFAAWATENGAPGAFLDLQARQPEKVLEIAEELARFRHLFSDDFVWFVNGTAQPALWQALDAALGTTLFSGHGAWEEAKIKNRFVVRGDALGREKVVSDFSMTLAMNVETLSSAASRISLLQRTRRPSSVEQLELLDAEAWPPSEGHASDPHRRPRPPTRARAHRERQQ